MELLAANPVITADAVSPEFELAQLNQVSALLEVFEDITVLTTDGEVRASTTSTYLGSWKDSFTFRNALSGETFISHVLVAPDPRDLVIYISAPVMRDGQVSAVVVGRMNMQEFWNILQPLVIGESGHAFVIDEHGHIIFDLDPERLLTTFTFDASTTHRLIDKSVYVVSPPLGVQRVNPKVETQVILIEFSDDSEVFLGGFTEIEELGWQVGAVQLKSEALAAATDMRNSLLTAFAIMLMTALVGAFLLPQYLSRPLNSLGEAMGNIAAGNFSQRVPTSGLLEIEPLAGAFNLMATSVEAANSELRDMAITDSLTGLLNRRGFSEQVEIMLRNARTEGATGAILFIDLDDFKALNDSLGHHAGDRLLQEIALTLQSKLKPHDRLSRLGGDEFAVLLTDVKRAAAQRRAGQILDAIAGLDVDIGVRSVKTTASIGVALIPKHGHDEADLLSRADLALYSAKGMGGNRAVTYRIRGRPFEQSSEVRQAWKERIIGALQNNQFELYAQPIVDLKSRSIAHYELLLRMVAENGEVSEPSLFLSVAERYGLISDIDIWVANKAVQWLSERQAAGRNESISFNLSASSLSDKRVLNSIRKVISSAGVDLTKSTIEITETTAVTDFSTARKFLDDMREFGCKFALDDFGVGFASFAQLRKLGFDYVKIDGTFIRDIENSEMDARFVRGIVEVVRGTGGQTIAEFVGSEATTKILTQIGVDFGQGFYLGKPKPLSEIDAASSQESVDRVA